MKFLQKLQSLSLEKRKMVLWMTVGVVGLIFLFVFSLIISLRFKNIDFQSMREGSNIPPLEIPNFNE